MPKERNYHFDNIKALLMLLVVVGHVFSKFDGGPIAGVTYKIIFSFHIPVFIFVSGYFAKYNPKKVFSSLLPLYVFFQLVEYVETGIISLIQRGVWQPSEPYFFFKSNFALWYLLVLMIYQLLIPLFDTKSTAKRAILLIVAFGLGIGIGFVDTGNVLSLSRTFVFLPYFMLGYYEKDAQVLKKTKQDQPIVCKIAALIFLGGVIAFFVIYAPCVNHRVFLGKDVFASPFASLERVATWLLGLVGIFNLYMLVPERKIPLVSKIEQNTLSVYLLHAVLILALIKTPVYDVVRSSYVGMWVFAIVLTLILSLDIFAKALRKISIPLGRKE